MAIYILNHDLWRIRENKSKCAWYHKGEDKGLRMDLVNYNGYVYDIELKRNHILWVRRNGKTAWSGNCLCYVAPVLKDTDEFVRELIEWRDNPDLHPDIEKWYNKTYKVTHPFNPQIESEIHVTYMLEGAKQYIDDRRKYC